MRVKDTSSEPPDGQVRLGTLVWEEIEGSPRTIFVTNDAIAHYRGLPKGKPLMVEECSDFVSGHRGTIIKAATKKLGRIPAAAEQITLTPGDL